MIQIAVRHIHTVSENVYKTYDTHVTPYALLIICCGIVCLKYEYGGFYEHSGFYEIYMLLEMMAWRESEEETDRDEREREQEEGARKD